LEHIYEALKLTSDGIYLKTADSVDPDVQRFIYGKESESKSNTDLTNTSKVIYKIFIDSIAPKLGGTDQVSVVQKLFMFHVGKGNLVNSAKLIFVHLLDAIDSKKAIIHHGRLLSHMFAQSGLLDAVKPFFPGFGTYMTSAQMVNSTTLRYLKLIKNDKIVHPQNPLLIRETEDGIEECRLVHVSERDAKNIVQAHVNFLKKNYGADVANEEMEGLTVRQKRLLGTASRVFLKRKATKSPSGPRQAKAAKVKTGARKPKRQRKLLLEVTEEEKKEDDEEDNLRLVAEFEKKEKEKENSWECTIDPKEFDDMYDKLPKKDAQQTLELQKIYKDMDNGKYPNYIVNGSVHVSVLEKSTSKQPPLVPINRVFKTLIGDVDPPKGCQKNLSYAEMQSLRGLQSTSNQSEFQTKPPVSQNKPS
jgi:hypothetical protein